MYNKNCGLYLSIVVDLLCYLSDVHYIDYSQAKQMVDAVFCEDIVEEDPVSNN